MVLYYQFTARISDNITHLGLIKVIFLLTDEAKINKIKR